MSESPSDFFMVCTGPSLNKLTKDEIDYINSCRVLSLNRYLMFWDILKITPNYHVYVDNDVKTKNLIKHTYEKFRRHRLRYFCHPKHIDILNEIGTDYVWDVTQLHENYQSSQFAENFDDPPFWATGAGLGLNLIYLLADYTIKNVKIIGMDGGRLTHFWIPWMNENIDKIPQTLKNFKDDCVHTEHISNHLYNPHSRQIVEENFNKKGIKVFNCNKDSVFVKNGIANYSPILPE